MNFLGIKFNESKKNDVSGYSLPPVCPSCHSNCTGTCERSCGYACSNSCQDNCGDVARWW
ncbi:MAG: hypothetical protein JEZ08_24760 [Clostridiales bacterium]|nr:hypothetical protein [Clostridiales bacterium]